MITIVQAPDETKVKGIKLFIAGGISSCPYWQNDLILRLKKETNLNESKKIKLIVFNPRCTEKPEENAQIKWEFKKLKKSDIISFWFSEGSVNPITLFEYGSHFKSKKKKIVVGCHPDYEKRNNIIIQTELAKPKLKVQDNFDDFYNELFKTIKKFK